MKFESKSILKSEILKFCGMSMKKRRNDRRMGKNTEQDSVLLVPANKFF